MLGAIRHYNMKHTNVRDYTFGDSVSAVVEAYEWLKNNG